MTVPVTQAADAAVETRAPISVLMVVGAYYPEISGGGLQCRTLVLALRDRVRFMVLTTTSDPEQPRQSVVDGVPVYRVHVDSRRPLSKLRATVEFLRLAPRLVCECDLIHFHGFTQKMLLLVLLGRLAGRRILEKMTSVGWDDPIALRSRPWGRALFWGFARANRYVSVSPAMSERFARAGLPESSLVFIPNGVDADRFRPAAEAERMSIRRALGLPADATVVTFVGFWSWEKGPHLLFEAWNRAREATGTKSLLLYIGATGNGHGEADPALLEEVQRRVRAEGLDGCVRIVERTHDVPSYLQASDIFVLPSSREGLPNALLEAMAAGLPCVSVRIPGVTDWLLEDGDTGFLVPPGDEEALRAVIATLLRDEERRRRVGARAREFVLQTCSVRSVADAYLALYRSLVAAT